MSLGLGVLGTAVGASAGTALGLGITGQLLGLLVAHLPEPGAGSRADRAGWELVIRVLVRS
jgi:hypothetical protein